MPSPAGPRLPELDRPLLQRFAETVVDVARPDPTRPLPAERLAELLRTGRFPAEVRRVLAVSSLSLAQRWGRVAFLAGPGADASSLVETWWSDTDGAPDGDTPRRAWPTDEVDRLSVEGALPPWLASRWLGRFGFERALSLAQSMNEPAPVVLRTNVSRLGRDALLERLKSEGLRVQAGRGPAAIVVEGPANLFGTSAWREGLFEVQDAASQQVVDSLEFPEDACVVDLCAGSGGKTLAIAAALGGRGRVVAVEPVEARLSDLRGRLRRTDIAGVELRHGSALDPALLADLRGRVDVVLVDAPCSSLGVLRRSPGRKWVLGPADVVREGPLQRALLDAASPLLRPGGLLAFATCSTEPEEGETVASGFESSHASAFHRVGEWRTFPDVDGGDGFFFASWRLSAPEASRAA